MKYLPQILLTLKTEYWDLYIEIIQMENRFKSIQNSQKLSSKIITEILDDFLLYKISFDTFKQKFQKKIFIDFCPSYREIKIIDASIREDIKISVSKTQLIHVLEKYSSGEISASELSNWASIIYMLPFYVPDQISRNVQFENDANIIWDILHKLSMPDLYDGINTEIIDTYIGQLID